MEKRRQEIRQELLDRTKAEIAERLASVCATMPLDEFERLVHRMATIKIKYMVQRNEDFFSESLRDNATRYVVRGEERHPPFR